MSSARQNCKGKIWSGTIGGKSVVWTGDDVFLTSQGLKQTLFRPSAIAMHRVGVETTISNLKYIGGGRGVRKNPMFKTSVRVETLSVVDSIVTFEVETLSFLEGYPGSHNTWWLTLDLSKAGKIEPFSADDVQNFDVSGIVDLRTMFAKDDLYNGMIENPKVRAALGGDNGRAYHDILKRWMDRKDDLSKTEEKIPTDEQGLSLIEYTFQHFVFDRIENEKVVVRLALVNLAASDTYSNDYIEIYLPINGVVGSYISSASRGEHGFLAKDRNNVSRGCISTIDLGTMIFPNKKKRIMSKKLE